MIARFGEQPQFREQGVLGRFLYTLPPSLLGHRNTDAAPVPEAVRALYHAMLTKLLNLPCRETDAGPRPNPLYFNAAAQAAVHAFRRWQEPQFIDGGDLEEIPDWGGKLHGTLVRTSSLLHLAMYAGESSPWKNPVDEGAVQRGETLCRYLIPQAKKALRLVGQDGLYPRAGRVLRYVAKKGLSEVSRRDLHRNLDWLFPYPTLLDETLALLTDHGYLRLKPRAPSGGRPTETVYEVNPLSKGGEG